MLFTIRDKMKHISDEMKGAESSLQDLQEQIGFLCSTLDRTIVDDEDSLAKNEFDKLKITLAEADTFVTIMQKDYLAAKGLRTMLAPPVPSFLGKQERLSTMDQEGIRKQLSVEESVKIRSPPTGEGQEEVSAPTTAAAGGSPALLSGESPSPGGTPRSRGSSLLNPLEKAASDMQQAADDMQHAAEKAAEELKKKASTEVKKARKWLTFIGKASHTITAASENKVKAEGLTARLKEHLNKINFALSLETLHGQKRALKMLNDMDARSQRSCFGVMCWI